MKQVTMCAFGLVFSSTVAFADGHVSGDAAAGEGDFRACKTCHSITAADGNVIERGGKVGPDLYGVVGRTAGTFDGFRYSDSMVAAGAAGLEWSEEEFVKYVADPTPYLRDYTGDSKARGKMTFKLGDEQKAKDIWAYLASVGPTTK